MKPAMTLFQLAALLLAPCFHSEAATPNAQHHPQATTQGAMVAGIDADTGKLRQLSDAEILALSIKANSAIPANAGNSPYASMPRTAAAARKRMRNHGNGVSTVDLPLSTLTWLTAAIGEDNQIEISEDAPALASDSNGGEE